VAVYVIFGVIAVCSVLVSTFLVWFNSVADGYRFCSIGYGFVVLRWENRSANEPPAVLVWLMIHLDEKSKN